MTRICCAVLVTCQTHCHQQQPAASHQIHMKTKKAQLSLHVLTATKCHVDNHLHTSPSKSSTQPLHMSPLPQWKRTLGPPWRKVLAFQLDLHHSIPPWHPPILSLAPTPIPPLKQTNMPPSSQPGLLLCHHQGKSSQSLCHARRKLCLLQFPAKHRDCCLT